jgi:hypothetical protein
LGVKFLVFFDPQFRIPGVFSDFPEELISAHHFGVTFLVMLQIDKVTIAKFLTPVWEFSRKNVGMAVDFQHQGLKYR